jgi:hypothetical protein
MAILSSVNLLYCPGAEPAWYVENSGSIGCAQLVLTGNLSAGWPDLEAH